MKKVLALTLAIVMIASVAMFAGCGNSADTKSSADAKTYIIYSDNAFAPFEFLDTKYPEVPNSIATDKVISDEIEEKLKKAIEQFKADFLKA